MKDNLKIGEVRPVPHWAIPKPVRIESGCEITDQTTKVKVNAAAISQLLKARIMNR